MAGILSIQTNPIIENKKLNLENIKKEIQKNTNNELDLVIMPEFFSTGISQEFGKNPEDENGGETIRFIQNIAQEFNTNIIAGTVIEKTDNKCYNTTFAINRSGDIIGKYRKIHLFNYMGGNEGNLITPGNKEVVVDMDFCKVGLAICFDIRYPLHFKKLAKMGAEIIVLPTAWVIPDEVFENKDTLRYAQEMWISMLRTRAYDNMVYLVSSGLTKKVDEKRSCLGTSLIISPTAEILAKANTEEGSIYAQIDTKAVNYLKSIYPIADID
ncbi:carbon-nitrogen hydrolase family protein [bacterium]|nr:carbon-nitrogen hydrolase family protein [bacterium]